MSVDLSPVVTATARWLTHVFPPAGGALSGALADVQARQAVTVAAWLRYPTQVDVALMILTGPGGSARLDWLADADNAELSEEDHAWRTWVDEVVASWAACLLTDRDVAVLAVAAVADTEHMSEVPCEFRRLTEPDDHDWQSTVLLRHPDLTGPIADLHRMGLLDRLGTGSATVA